MHPSNPGHLRSVPMLTLGAITSLAYTLSLLAHWGYCLHSKLKVQKLGK